MRPWMMALLATRSRIPVMLTFPAGNSTWVAPATTSKLETASGKGAAGTPSSTATTSNVRIDQVQGSATGTGASSGALAWSAFTDADLIVSRINAGTQGSSYNSTTYTGYPNTNTYTISLVTGLIAANYIPGTASASYSAGWKTSGTVLASDDGTSYISYQYTNGATTGAATTGFGKTFPGGSSGPASTTTFSNVAVTPGASYSIVVPAGGTLTITYYQ